VLTKYYYGKNVDVFGTLIESHTTKKHPKMKCNRKIVTSQTVHRLLK
jgi:hypothetical protein